MAKQLNLPPAQCLVIEDSAAGVKAAIAAGMWCIAVTTEYTREAVYASKLLDSRWIVDDPASLVDVAKHMIAERMRVTRYSAAVIPQESFLKPRQLP